jgi:hypothetical protein
MPRNGPDLGPSHNGAEFLQFLELLNQLANVFNGRMAKNLSDHYPTPKMINDDLVGERASKPLPNNSSGAPSFCTAKICPYPAPKACEFFAIPNCAATSAA